MLNRKNKVLTTIGLLALIFLMVPLIIVIITSFGEESTISFPIKGFTLQWFINIFNQPDFLNGFTLSLIIAAIASFLSLLICLPAVYVLSRTKIAHQNWFSVIFLSPTFVPEIVIGFALYQTFIIFFQAPLLITLLVGHLLLSIPYSIRIITASMMLLDTNVEEAALIYGSRKINTFFKIIVPSIYPSLIASFLLSFINSFNNIPISLFLNGPDLTTLPMAILNYLQNNYDPTVSAISTILMILTMITMFLIDKILGLKKIMG